MSSRRVTPSRLAALLALPAAAVVVGPAAPPAGADDPELVEVCWTDGLTDDEATEGEYSEITCEWLPEEDPFGGQSARGGAIILGQIWDEFNGGGRSVLIRGGADCDENVRLPGQWANWAQSTINWSCGNMKHYTDANYSSLYYNPPYGQLRNLTNNYSNNVESIAFS